MAFHLTGGWRRIFQVRSIKRAASLHPNSEPTWAEACQGPETRAEGLRGSVCKATVVPQTTRRDRSVTGLWPGIESSMSQNHHS